MQDPTIALLDKKIEEVQSEMTAAMQPYINVLESLRATRNAYALHHVDTVKENKSDFIPAATLVKVINGKSRLTLVKEAITELGHFAHKSEIEKQRDFSRPVSDVLSVAGADPKSGIKSYCPTGRKAATYWGFEEWMEDGKPKPEFMPITS